MLKVVQVVRPAWVVCENVAGYITMELDHACSDLEAEGYTCWPLVLPACAVGAPHRRDRVWIIAFAQDTNRRKQRRSSTARNQSELGHIGAADSIRPTADTFGARLQGHEFTGASTQGSGASRPATEFHSDAAHAYGGREQQPRGPQSKVGRWDRHGDPWAEPWPTVIARLCRVDDGLPRGMDRRSRIKALGNTIVPQVAYQIFDAIKRTYE
jgi:DNA (cytosine-5)-methyltransferase 1